MVLQRRFGPLGTPSIRQDRQWNQVEVRIRNTTSAAWDSSPDHHRREFQGQRSGRAHHTRVQGHHSQTTRRAPHKLLVGLRTRCPLNAAAHYNTCTRIPPIYHCYRSKPKSTHDTTTLPNPSPTWELDGDGEITYVEVVANRIEELHKLAVDCRFHGYEKLLAAWKLKEKAIDHPNSLNYF